MGFSQEIFIESRTARDNQLSTSSSQEAENILNKVKQIFFAVWDGEGWMASKQVAEFYEVPEETIDTSFKRHRDEFQSDGVQVLRGKALEDVRFIMNLTSSKAPSIKLFPPRAVMRMGFTLRDSEIAKQVRNVALDMIEALPSLVANDTLILKLEYLASFKEPPLGSKDNPITEITKDIRNGYGWAGSEDIMEQLIVSLASYANLSPWRQVAQRTYYKTSKNKARRFDLLFQPKVSMYKKLSNVVILNEFKSNYIDYEDVKYAYEVKRYIDLAYNQFIHRSRLVMPSSSLVFQFISPCGITEDGLEALNEVQKHADEKYIEKIYIDAVRLDDFVWNQLYPAIRQTYQDEQGDIGNQFFYVKDKIIQICLEICNPDLWVDQYKTSRQEYYKAILNRDRYCLPGHSSSFVPESLNSGAKFRQIETGQNDSTSEV
ncbi:hypothetical protein [Anabaena lutea]|uniref:Uncharacterized protein n=1 Tax=Anabaena lutea FACHB-196 TaxID=2692881 RepID=A0ABR8FM22_9NOST|nr:hypothetical protein [Anabaena lutea]MBD2569875.1 hypothetical protein [Anabaena lutea FACHB-196]